MRDLYRTIALEVEGQSVLRDVVAQLIDRSAMFMIEPMPDDFWEITVKEEEKYTLTSMIAEAENNVVID